MNQLMSLVTVLFLSQVSFAAITGSDYEPRHQALIENVVAVACAGGYVGKLTQVSSLVVEDRVDNGIVDRYFTTELGYNVRIDQGVYDYYRVTVKSLLADAYDHETKNWGIYSIESVVCELQ
jgi:hypothetical protein